MGRLGVVITETFGGYKEIYSKNKSSEWSSLVDDMRTYTPSSSSMRLIFLRFIPAGTLVGIVRKIEERGDDNNAAWIFVPSDIAVPGQELVSVIDAVDAELKAPVADYQKIAAHFDKEYSESPVVGRSVSLNASEMAVRFYGAASPFVWGLNDILDSKHLYQPEYHNLKYVFLLNNKEMQNRFLGVPVIAEKPKLTESVKVEPLEMIDGFIPYVNGVPFNKPILAFVGDTIEVEWKKLEYKTVRKSFVVGGPKEAAFIAQSEYLRFVDPAKVVVFDRSTRQQVKTARIHIQGKLLQETGVYIPEYQYCRADIYVEHTEYEPVRLQGQDLNKTISVSLESRMFSYKFRMTLKNGSNCDFAVQANTPITECPIKGYELATNSRPMLDTVNRLTYKAKGGAGFKSSIISWVIILLIGLLAGAGIMFAIGKTTSLFKSKSVVTVRYGVHENTEKEEPASDNSENSDRQLQLAIDYLDGNDIWNKDAMDQFKYLKGLWIALDSWGFDRVLGSQYDVLEASEQFSQLREEIRKCNRDRFVGTYNSATNPSKDITYQNYINALKRVSERANSQPRQTAGTGRVNSQNPASVPSNTSRNRPNTGQSQDEI